MEGKSIKQRGMEETSDNGKESSHSARVNGMIESYLFVCKREVIRFSYHSLSLSLFLYCMCMCLDL